MLRGQVKTEEGGEHFARLFLYYEKRLILYDMSIVIQNYNLPNWVNRGELILYGPNNIKEKITLDALEMYSKEQKSSLIVKVVEKSDSDNL